MNDTDIPNIKTIPLSYYLKFVPINHV